MGKSGVFNFKPAMVSTKGDGVKGAPIGQGYGEATAAQTTAVANGSMNYNSNDTCIKTGK